MHKAGLKQEKGYTFIEIMVVAVLIGLFSALAYPNLTEALDNYKLKSAARELVSNIRYVRGRAVNGESSKVLIRYGINDATQYLIRKDLNTEKIITLPKGLKFGNSNPQEISFTLEGEPRQGGLTIAIEDERGQSVEVKITGATGRVRIE